MHAWRPFHAACSLSPSKRVGEALGGLPDRPCYGMPNRVLGSPDLMYGGARFVHLVWQGHAFAETGWGGALLQRVLLEHVELTDEAPSVWRVDQCPTSVEDMMLIYVPPSGALEERMRHAGAFFEVRALPSPRMLHVFALSEHGRFLQRSLVYSTHAPCTLKHLQEASAKRDVPWEHGLRRSAGNLFGTLLDANGKLVPVPGVGATPPGYGSLHIRRNRTAPSTSGEARRGDEGRDTARKDAPFPFDAEWAHEIFVPREFLTGLLPDALLERYVFWKSGPLMMRGYASQADDDTSILVYLRRQHGAQVLDSCQAEVCRISERGERMMLLNILQAREGSSLAKLGRTLVRLDGYSHMLVWTTSIASARELADVSLVELPRLKLRFEVQLQDGTARLYSTDYAGLFVSDEDDAAVSALARDIPHAVVLQDATRNKKLLVPNYALERVKIKSCPLNTELVMRCSQFELPAESWARDKWAVSVATRFYIYPVHLSGAFLQSPSLSATIYLVLVHLMRRAYFAASRWASHCFTDVPLSQEESWLLQCVKQSAIDDQHPDAQAVRLKMALVCFSSGAVELPWDASKDLDGYIAKHRQVSSVCRLSVDEEELLLQKLPEPSGPVSRCSYLKALQEAAERHSASHPDAERPVEMSIEGSRCEVGGHAVRYVASWLTENRNKKIHELPHLMDCYTWRYHRPQGRVEGLHAVDLLRTFEKDDLMGRKHGTGIVLLYEMLQGRVDLAITARTRLGAIVEGVQVPPREISKTLSHLKHKAQEHAKESSEKAPKKANKSKHEGEKNRAEQDSPDVSGGDARGTKKTTCDAQDDVDDGDVEATQKCGIFEAEEAEEAPRHKPAQASVTLVKLMLAERMLNETAAFKQQKLNGEAASGLALLLPSISAALHGGEELPRFPSFPVSRNKEALKTGCNNGRMEDKTVTTNFQLGCFEMLLCKQNQAYCRSSAWNRDISLLPAAQLYPSSLSIPAGHRLNCVPPSAPSTCTTRILRDLHFDKDSGSLPGDGKSALNISCADVSAFATRPLEHLDLSAHIEECASGADGMLQGLPFDLAHLGIAHTGVAKAILGRMEGDIAASYCKAHQSKVTRLIYLGDRHIGTLEHESQSDVTSDHVEGEPEEGDGSPCAMVRTVSASSSAMLSNALQRLAELRHALDAEQSDEAVKTRKAVQALVDMGNETSGACDACDQIRFEMMRFARQRISPWFELLAACQLSSCALEGLRRLNPCLSAAQAHGIIDATSGVLMRSNRLSQLNRATACVDQLVRDIKVILEQRLVARWVGRLDALDADADLVPSPEMVRHALEASAYDEKLGSALLEDLLDARRGLVSWARQRSRLDTNDLKSACMVALALCHFDPARSRACLEPTAELPDAAAHILDLARRGCRYKGKSLISPPRRGATRRDSAAGQQDTLGASAHQERLRAMVHLLRHSSCEVASILGASREYVCARSHQGEETQLIFDPRFLAFEYMSGFLLRRRQVELVNDFATDASQGRSRVEQMIMGQGHPPSPYRRYI